MLYIVYRQVFLVKLILHFEPSLDALSLLSDVMRSIKILFFCVVGVRDYSKEMSEAGVNLS